MNLEKHVEQVVQCVHFNLTVRLDVEEDDSQFVWDYNYNPTFVTISIELEIHRR